MARGQYDLPLNTTRATRPVYGPQRPPLSPSPTSSSPPRDRSTTQHRRPSIVLLSSPTSPQSKSQIVALRTKLKSEASVQIVDSADAAIAALSQKPSAVIVPDNTLSEPAFELARTEILRYAQNGGRLITDLSQYSTSPVPSACIDSGYASEDVDYNMKANHVSEIRDEHLVS